MGGVIQSIHSCNFLPCKVLGSYWASGYSMTRTESDGSAISKNIVAKYYVLVNSPYTIGWKGTNRIFIWQCKGPMPLRYTINCWTNWRNSTHLIESKVHFGNILVWAKKSDIEIVRIILELFADGRFGAMMQVHIQNNGPVTLEIESPTKWCKTYMEKIHVTLDSDRSFKFKPTISVK